MTDVGGVRGVLVALLLVQVVIGCTVTTDGGQGGGAVQQTWDLQDTSRADAVGFPDDTDLHTVEPADGLREILLPDDVVITGFARVGVTRHADDDALDSMIVTFPREAVDDVLQRAEGWASQTGLDVQRIREWAAIHADGVQATSGATQAMTPAVQLGGGPELTLTTRAFPVDGDALMRLELFWPA